MVIDTSALIEIFISGPEAKEVRAALKTASGHRFMSAASLLEAHIVVRRRFGNGNPGARQLLDRLVGSYAIAIEGIQQSQAELAVEAYYRYGKGGGTGVLNFGDCLAYALAKQRNDTLLFVGNDFSQTDIKIART